MVLGWNVRLTDSHGDEHGSVTSKQSLDAATRPVLMHEIIDDPTRQDDPRVDDLFVGSEAELALYAHKTPAIPPTKSMKRQQGKILQLKERPWFHRVAQFPQQRVLPRARSRRLHAERPECGHARVV